MTFTKAFLIGAAFIILWMILIGWSWSMWSGRIKKLTLDSFPPRKRPDIEPTSPPELLICIRCGKVSEEKHMEFACFDKVGPFCDGCYDIYRCACYGSPDPLPETRWAEWQVFTPDFDYYKKFYDVLLPDGTIVVQCWPNAGWMNAINGDGRKWGPQDNIKVRLSHKHPMDD